MLSVSPAALNLLKEQGYTEVRRFSGPKGSGKTTRARAYMQELQAAGRQVYLIHDDRGDGTDIVYATAK